MEHLASAFPLPTTALTDIATSSGTIFADLFPLMSIIVGILLAVSAVGILIRFFIK